MSGHFDRLVTASGLSAFLPAEFLFEPTDFAFHQCAHAVLLVVITAPPIWNGVAGSSVG